MLLFLDLADSVIKYLPKKYSKQKEAEAIFFFSLASYRIQKWYNMDIVQVDFQIYANNICLLFGPCYLRRDSRLRPLVGFIPILTQKVGTPNFCSSSSRHFGQVRESPAAFLIILTESVGTLRLNFSFSFANFCKKESLEICMYQFNEPFWSLWSLWKWNWKAKQLRKQVWNWPKNVSFITIFAPKIGPKHL